MFSGILFSNSTFILLIVGSTVFPSYPTPLDSKDLKFSSLSLSPVRGFFVCLVWFLPDVWKFMVSFSYLKVRDKRADQQSDPRNGAY
jgi:hypothetical protein